LGVRQLDVTDCAWKLFDLARNAFAALTAQSHWPVQALSSTHLGRPWRADGCEIVAEDERRAATIGTVYHDHVSRWKLHAGIECRDAGVVPLGAAAHEDVGQHRSSELERLRHARKIVGHRDTTQNRREVQDRAALRLRELLVG